MEKNALNILDLLRRAPAGAANLASRIPTQALVGAGGLAAGGGLGYLLGNKSEQGNINALSEDFMNYNQQENKQIADDAFMTGIEYALSGAEGPEKMSFYKEYVAAGFQDELEKNAGPRIDLAISALKGLGGMAKRDLGPKAQAIKQRVGEALKMQNVRGYQSLKSTVGRTKTPYMTALDAKIMSNQSRMAGGDLAIAGGIAAGAGAVGLGLKKLLKQKTLMEKLRGITMKDAQKFVMKNKAPFGIGAGTAALGVMAAS